VNVRSAFPRQEGVPLTARKIDGMYRLAEASAKARLSDHVSADDAKSAIRLVVACLKQIGMEDNGYNIDVIECNGTKSQRDNIKQLKEYIMDHVNCSREDIQRDLGFSEEYTSSLVKKLKHSGDLIEVGHNILRCTC
jgi:replicative DNA helicase Mcm